MCYGYGSLRSMMKPKLCPNCTQEFIPATKSRIFCSNSCSVTWSRRNGLIPSQPRQGVTKTCKHCKVEFYVPKYRDKTAIYCSRRCSALDKPLQSEKARNNSPIMARKGKTEKKQYKEITINGKRVRVHRFLMEVALGRKLESWEHVHHIDGNHLNNSIENLEVLSNSEHQKKELRQWSKNNDSAESAS